MPRLLQPALLGFLLACGSSTGGSSSSGASGGAVAGSGGSHSGTVEAASTGTMSGFSSGASGSVSVVPFGEPPLDGGVDPRCNGQAAGLCMGSGAQGVSVVIDPVLCASVIAATLVAAGRPTGITCQDFCLAWNAGSGAGCVLIPDGGLDYIGTEFAPDGSLGYGQEVLKSSEPGSFVCTCSQA